MLLLAFPDLRQEEGTVADRLQTYGASGEVMRVWKELVAQEIKPSEDEDEF